ncbi:MAG: NAD-dependent epimerase/dehydratase family protein [bacterium]|nr:NAD-dependent epimerase/dehydratase family protein [bacterium]
MTKYFITGGAGFIGSHLTDSLINKGRVAIYDNLSSGSKEFIARHFKKDNFRFIKGDLLDEKFLNKSMAGSDFVFHLAANPDIQLSVKKPSLDFEQGNVATFNVLEAMRKNSISKICFSSSSAVFGEPKIMPTPEDYGPLLPISTYGASKLACEGLISAYCHIYGFQAWMFRFANVIGPRLTHGAIHDFIKKLGKNKKTLEVLGDGNQSKSYIHVKDCIEGMIFGASRAGQQLNIFNLGANDRTKVKDIAQALLKEMGLDQTKIIFTGGKRGWQGDVPQMLLDISRMGKLGWQPKYNSMEAVIKTIKENI